MNECHLASALIALAAAATLPSAADAPIDSGLTEEVVTERAQFEVIAWPKDGDPKICAQLDLERIEIFYGGAWRDVRDLHEVRIDRIGVAHRDIRPGEDPPAVATDHSPLRMAIYFDETRLLRGFTGPEEGSLRDRAYRQTVDMIRDRFRPEDGDRLLLARHVGSRVPQVASGWLDDRDEALAVLERMRAAGPPPDLDAPRLGRHRRLAARDPGLLRFFAAFEALVDAIRQPDHEARRSTMILLFGGDIEIDARFGEELAELSARLAAARASVHTVDVRSILASQEYGIGSSARSAGGRFWTNGAVLSNVVRSLRALTVHGCRLLITVPVGKIESVRVDLRDARFYERTLPSLGDGDPATREDEVRARRLLPRWGEGLDVEGALWPVREERGRVRAVLLARVLLEELPARRLPPLVLNVRVEDGSFAVHDPSDDLFTTPEERTLRVAGEQRTLLRATGRATYLFEVELRRSARPAYRVLVESIDERNGAKVEAVLDDGARPRWALVESAGRFEEARTDLLPVFAVAGENRVPLPSPDARIEAGRFLNFVGRGCGSHAALRSHVVGPDGAVVDLSVERLANSGENGRCSWYRATHSGDLPAGQWTFHPPPGLCEIPIAFEVRAPASERR
jgi:hypothetical protein